jgi:restriction system protein
VGKRSGFEGFLRAAARAAVAAEREQKRQIRAAEAMQRRAVREARMRQNALLRDQKAAEREARAQYLEDRQAEADDRNADVEERLNELRGLLAHTFTHDDRIDFDALHVRADVHAFQVPQELLPGRRPSGRAVSPLSWYQKLIPGATARYAVRVKAAEAEFQRDLATFSREEEDKRKKIEQRRQAHEKLLAVRKAEADAKNAQIDQLKAAYLAKESDAVLTYNEMVLTRSQYPDEGFPQAFRLAYVRESSELVVEYELPEPGVIPIECDFKYVRTRDAIESRQRKPAEVKQIYQDMIASITLRTLHELFEADQADACISVAFTGVRDTHDAATGQPVRVPVVSVRATKQEFTAIKLERVEKIACLRGLGAQVASRPEELQAIKPIVEFDMVDKRFVESGDALSGLESRPNLLELTPTEFEVLVSNLFTKMGLDTKLTRASRDGGVDAVAFDVRPVIGGKVVIQAKRYKDTVGVSAVRDLYGTMQHEGANKGILVCTSGYGPDAFQFAKDKPIELIDGGGLLYLLREHAGITARIMQ